MITGKKNRYIFAVLALFGSRMRPETFADAFKPLRLPYLYKLFDKHQEKHKELNAMFAIKRKYNVKNVRQKRVIAYSLFCKGPRLKDRNPSVSPQKIHVPSKSIKKGGSFYDIYVRPLIRQLRVFRRFFPGWIARVYLASDLAFLVPKLLLPNVEVFLMESTSLAAAPGSLWRFLVFDDPSVSIGYIRDADFLAARLNGDFKQSRKINAWARSHFAKGFFRLRDFGHDATVRIGNMGYYSPIVASAFGAKKVRWLRMEKAIKGFILHRMLFQDENRHAYDVSTRRHPYGFGNRFPDYGFDERFLKHVIYFEAVDRHQLTTLVSDHNGLRDPQAHEWIKLDLRYLRAKRARG